MSTPDNTAQVGTAHSNILTAQSCTYVPGWDRTYNALVRILLSQRTSPQCQPGICQRFWEGFLVGDVTALIFANIGKIITYSTTCFFFH